MWPVRRPEFPVGSFSWHDTIWCQWYRDYRMPVQHTRSAADLFWVIAQPLSVNKHRHGANVCRPPGQWIAELYSQQSYSTFDTVCYFAGSSSVLPKRWAPHVCRMVNFAPIEYAHRWYRPRIKSINFYLYAIWLLSIFLSLCRECVRLLVVNTSQDLPTLAALQRLRLA